MGQGTDQGSGRFRLQGQRRGHRPGAGYPGDQGEGPALRDRRAGNGEEEPENGQDLEAGAAFWGGSISSPEGEGRRAEGDGRGAGHRPLPAGGVGGAPWEAGHQPGDGAGGVRLGLPAVSGAAICFGVHSGGGRGSSGKAWAVAAGESAAALGVQENAENTIDF